MKTSNVNQGRAHPEAIIRGWVSSKRAGSTGVGSSDITTITAITDDLYLTRRGGLGHYLVTETASGTALTLILASGNWFDITLSASCTLTFDATGLDSGVGLEWTLILRQDAVGSRTVTWPAAVAWQDTDGTDGGAAPTLYTAATAEDVIVITTLDGGVTYGGGQERSGSGSSLTVQDEGTPLATSATTLNFVGSGVVASGSGATKTITITGGGALDDLSDVTITSPANANRLRYDGSTWANSNLVWEPMIATDGSVMTDGLLNPMQSEVPY